MNNLWTVLQQGVAGAITALFLLLLQRLFRDKLSPRWQYGVWAVLLLRLLVPAGAGGRSTALDLWPWIEPLRVGVERRLTSAYASPWAQTLPSAPWPVPPGTAPQSFTDWLFVLYLAGAALCLFWFVGCALRLRGRVGRGVPVAGPRLETIRQVAARYRLPCPRRVVECRWDHGPFLMGVLRPTLVLPMGWEPEEKVILHELLHLKYRDVLAGWVVTLFRCLYWWNPVLWYAFDRMGQDREVLCDQRVLERLEGEDRRDYGRCLLAMADDRAVRTPGATTMANGARGVKERIAAIARFKRYPQGMALVSGCITFALALALVAGAPAQALLEADTGGAVTASGSTDAALAAGQLHRATTVAGALDAYGKGLLLRWEDRETALMCQAMVRPSQEMPGVLAEWEASAPVSPDSSGTSLQAQTDLNAAALNWWTTGPQFRGLVSDGQGGYLCQVLWYRDVDELALWVDGAPQPESGEPWPVEYLCHTVQVRPAGRYWTVHLLAETQGNVDSSPLRGPDEVFLGPVTWVGEADGVQVTLSPAHLLESGDGMLGQNKLRDRSGGTWSWSFQSQSQAPVQAPMPGTTFCSVEEEVYWTVRNTGADACSAALRATPLWDGPGGPEAKAAAQTMTADPLYLTYPLAAGELQSGRAGSGGVSGTLGEDLDYFLGPDTFRAVLTVDGREQELTLTRTYTTPDGGSYTLPGEEDIP